MCWPPPMYLAVGTGGRRESVSSHTPRWHNQSNSQLKSNVKQYNYKMLLGSSSKWHLKVYSKIAPLVTETIFPVWDLHRIVKQKSPIHKSKNYLFQALKMPFICDYLKWLIIRLLTPSVKKKGLTSFLACKGPVSMWIFSKGLRSSCGRRALRRELCSELRTW